MILGTAGAVLNTATSFLSGSDPKKDAERKARFLNYYNQAKGGSAEGEARLYCAAGKVTPQALTLGIVDPASGCSLAGGSDVGRVYAQGLVLKLEAERGISDTLVSVGVNAVGAGVKLDPGSIERATGVPTWALALGAGILAFLAFKALR